MNIENWTKDDYRTFTLLYTANIDIEISETEKEFIEERANHANIKQLKRESAHLSDYECLQIIENNREKFYPGNEGKQKLLDEITEICKSDGDYSQVERVIVHALSRVL